jgi:hypothetical protein
MLKPVLLIHLSLILISPFSSYAQARDARNQPMDTTRFVEGQTLISKSNPQVKIRFSKNFKFAGHQSFILFENSEVTQFYFAQVDSVNHINALFTIQFENYLPGINERYNYKIKDSVLINNISFLRSPVYNEPAKVLKDTVKSDVWHRFNFLKSKGYRLPDEVIGHRFVRLIDETRQKEVLIIYNEDIKRTGVTSAELDTDKNKLTRVLDKLFKAALDGFVIVAYK